MDRGLRPCDRHPEHDGERNKCDVVWKLGDRGRFGDRTLALSRPFADRHRLGESSNTSGWLMSPPFPETRWAAPHSSLRRGAEETGPSFEDLHLIRQLGSGFRALRRVFYKIKRSIPSKFRFPQAKSPAKSALFRRFFSLSPSLHPVNCARNAGRRRLLLQHCPGGREPTRRSICGLRAGASAGVVPGSRCRTRGRSVRNSHWSTTLSPSVPGCFSRNLVPVARVSSTCCCDGGASKRLASAAAGGGASSPCATADALAEDGGAGCAYLRGRCCVRWFARAAGGLLPPATSG